MGDLRHAPPASRAREVLEIRGVFGTMVPDESDEVGILGISALFCLPTCPVGSKSEGVEEADGGHRKDWLVMGSGKRQTCGCCAGAGLVVKACCLTWGEAEGIMPEV